MLQAVDSLKVFKFEKIANSSNWRISTNTLMRL